MTSVYVDTSALARVLNGEPDEAAVLAGLAAFETRVSSRLLALELRRVALRRSLSERANELIADVALVPVDDAILLAAESVVPATVSTLDAIHLATALRLGTDLDALMTYDAQLAAGAEHHGIRVIAQTG